MGLFGYRKSATHLVLEGTAIHLRAPRRRDYLNWFAVRHASLMTLQLREPLWSEDALSKKRFLRYVRDYSLAARYGLGLGFFIWDKQFTTLMGACNLTHIRRGPAQTAELGYWLGDAYQENGYAREAVYLLCRHAFNYLDLHRVEAACMDDNIASQRVLESNGFYREGYSKKYLKINGSWADHMRFALLKEDMQH